MRASRNLINTVHKSEQMLSEVVLCEEGVKQLFAPASRAGRVGRLPSVYLESEI